MIKMKDWGRTQRQKPHCGQAPDACPERDKDQKPMPPDMNACGRNVPRPFC